MAQFDNIKVKDQLGKPDEMGLFGPFRRSDTVFIEEHPTVVAQYDETPLAKWDDADTTWDGTDQNDEWSDFSKSNVRFIRQVVNHNNTFVWRFRFTDVNGDDNKILNLGFSDANITTATEDTTTNFRVDFTGSQVWVSKSVYKDSTLTSFITSATLQLTSSGTFTYYLSADGGIHWEEVSLGSEHFFTTTGFNLLIKVTESGVFSNWPTAFGAWGSVTNVWPTAFGTWGTALGGTGYISDIILEYK